MDQFSKDFFLLLLLLLLLLRILLIPWVHRGFFPLLIPDSSQQSSDSEARSTEKKIGYTRKKKITGEKMGKHS